jgi:GNAT superfamily N-acetyltransferase
VSAVAVPEHSIYTALPAYGWTRLARDSSRVYEDGGGSRYTTFERDGVRLAVSRGRSLGDHRGTVVVYDADPEEVVIYALLVDPAARRQGKARAALMDMASIADEQRLTLYIEPAPLEKGKDSISRDRLVSFYLSCGFCRTGSGSDRVLVRNFSCGSYPQQSVENSARNSLSPRN